MLELPNDIESVPGLVKLDAQRDDTQPKPSLRSPSGAAAGALCGVPMGHEFTSLVLALLQTAAIRRKRCRDPDRSNLNGNFNFETFVSLTSRAVRTWFRR